MKTYAHLRKYLSALFLQWEMFQTKAVEKIKTHILCSVAFFLSENRTIYNFMRKNMAESDFFLSNIRR